MPRPPLRLQRVAAQGYRSRLGRFTARSRTPYPPGMRWKHTAALLILGAMIPVLLMAAGLAAIYLAGSRRPTPPPDAADYGTPWGAVDLETVDTLTPSGVQTTITEALRSQDSADRGSDGQLHYDFLALSGGGSYGAFGAGVLCGWSEHGTRPTFDLVTGVSTGALTAPFAFLGSSADAGLRQVYTGITIADVLRQRSLIAAVFDDALADTAPLFGTISRHVDEAMLAGIAAGYREGRLLLVGTANLDAQTPVIWNIGAIAASGDPRALDLIRKLLLASASIPGAFPPVMIDVTVGGQPHQEMRVDGGAFVQLFLYPSTVTQARRERLRRRLPVQPAEAYIIRNARLDSEWAAVDRRAMTIAGRAISSMIASAGYNDILRSFNTTQADQVGFNLAYIGSDFTGTFTSPFDQAYMRQLFDYGFARARRGMNWAKQPPALGTTPITQG